MFKLIAAIHEYTVEPELSLPSLFGRDNCKLKIVETLGAIHIPRMPLALLIITSRVQLIALFAAHQTPHLKRNQ